MNERIKELWRTCVLKHTKDPMIWQTVADEFAELLIQECADIAKHHVMNISTYADAEFVSDQITQHFGVE